MIKRESKHDDGECNICAQIRGRTLRSRGTSGDAFSLIVNDADVCCTNRLHSPICTRR